MKFITGLHWFSIVMIPVSIGVIAWGIVTDQATTRSLVTMGFNLAAFSFLAFFVTPMMKDTQRKLDEVRESLDRLDEVMSERWYGDKVD